MRANARVISLRAAAGTALLASLLAVHPAAARPEPLTTAFTYQGELTAAGVPATGTFDLQFRLFDAAGGGAQIGSTLCSNDLVVENGRFTVSLDFGPVFAGQRGFLEIQVRQDAGQDCSDAAGFSPLSPRQEITATPHAAYALAANNATSLNGQSADFYRNAANLTGALPSSALSGTYAAPLILNNPSNFIAGNGASITNLSATSISSGTLNAARLPTNWAAGGDLTGFFPSPMIAPGAVTLGALTPSVRTSLSNLRTVTAPLDAVGWGDNTYGQLNLPALPANLSYTAVAGGGYHSLMVRSDGRVLACGAGTTNSGTFPNFGQSIVPALPVGLTYTAVAAGSLHSLALRSDGIVVAWGSNQYGQCNVPALPAGVTCTAVASGDIHSLALRSNGTIVGWGNNDYGQLDVPALPAGVSYTAVAAGSYHSLAVRSDGVAVAWGWNAFGQTNVPALPSGVTYTAVAGGSVHSLALCSDGTVIGWGNNSVGRIDVPALPVGVRYTAVAAGLSHSIALRSDGAVVAFGWNQNGQTNSPGLPTGVTYTGIAGGQFHSLALRGTPTSGLAAASFSGSGSGLTNLSASSITSGTLNAARLPSLDAGLITSGTLNAARLPSLDAGLITSGTLNAARLPSLDAGLITSGTVAVARIPNLDASKITTGILADAQIPNLDASKITSGTLATAQIPNLDASKITSGTLANAQTTGTDQAVPGTLVVRDALGNFEANRITAPNGFVGPLAGNATSASNTSQLNFQPASYYTNASNMAAGTLANARTTGTALNTPSTLVLRDASGNFAAGTITAALNGNATSATTAASATTATNATQLNAQPASFYTNASNLSSGTLPDARLSTSIPRLNTNNSFTSTSNSFAGRVGVNTPAGATELDVNGRINVASGVIQKDLSAGVVTATTDLGLYSQIAGGWIRFVTNGAQFAWFTDSGAGTNPRMTLSPTGNLTVSGSLAKAGGSFKIDHPLDPRNKILYHSFVESPDMMNIYNGEVTTDATGYAVITLPDYFEALNRDFRYQLTVIDDADQPDVVIWAKVVRRIGADGSNRFSIRSSRGNTVVSWQVTGIRHDAWANKNRIPNSVDKVGDEKGKYLHPDAFNQPADTGAHQVPVSTAQ